MKNTLRIASVSIIALGLTSFGAIAQDQVNSKISSGPTPVSENGVKYLSGGVGDNELKEINNAAKDYDLKLTFATAKHGAFLADVDVKIEDSKGNTVIDTTSDGPIFLADLPKGTYKIKAEAGDKKLEKRVTINGKQRVNTTFTWPEQVVQTSKADE